MLIEIDMDTFNKYIYHSLIDEYLRKNFLS